MLRGFTSILGVAVFQLSEISEVYNLSIVNADYLFSEMWHLTVTIVSLKFLGQAGPSWPLPILYLLFYFFFHIFAYC